MDKEHKAQKDIYGSVVYSPEELSNIGYEFLDFDNVVWGFDEESLYSVLVNTEEIINSVSLLRRLDKDTLRRVAVTLLELREYKSRFQLDSAVYDMGLLRRYLLTINRLSMRKDLYEKSIHELVEDYNILDILLPDKDNFINTLRRETIEDVFGKYTKKYRRVSDNFIKSLYVWDKVVEVCKSSINVNKTYEELTNLVPVWSNSGCSKFLRLVGISNVDDGGIPIVNESVVNFLQYVSSSIDRDIKKARKYKGNFNASDVFQIWCTKNAIPVVAADTLIHMMSNGTNTTLISDMLGIDLGGKENDYGSTRKEAGKGTNRGYTAGRSHYVDISSVRPR